MADIASYVSLAGDQIVYVPNGTYTASDVSAAHAATSGIYGGWLNLVAQSKGGVTVDLTTSDNREWDITGTSRVRFIGFNFDHGMIYNGATFIDWWWCDHQNFDLDYMANLNPDGSGTVAYTNGVPNYRRYLRGAVADGPPRMMVFTNFAHDQRVFGGDFHNATATIVYLAGSTNNFLFQGCRTGQGMDIRFDGQAGNNPGGLDPNSHCVPGPSTPQGGHNNLKVFDHYQEGTYVLFGSIQGSSNTLEHRRVDFAYTNPSPLLYEVDLNDGRTINHVTREDIRCWGGIADINNDPALYAPNGAGGAVQLNLGVSAENNVKQWICGSAAGVIMNELHNLQTSSPTYTTPSWAGVSKAADYDNPNTYANIWRANNPYSSWPQFFQLDIGNIPIPDVPGIMVSSRFR